jgi:hypothetical protein
MNTKLPNFFIVGAAKSGTTSLYNYLIQHPDIYLSPLKEPKYLSSSANKFPHKGPGDIYVDNMVIKTWDEYLQLFAGVRNEKCIGEASADYLYFYKCVIPLIKIINAEAKIIIILRNPIERAFSAYKHLVRDGREMLSFEKALDIEEQRKKENYEFIWFYKDVGFYYNQVKAYLEAFGITRVRVYLFDDFSKKPFDIINDIFKFLEVNKDFIPDMSPKYNVSEVPRIKFLQRFLMNYNHPIKKLSRPILLKTIGKENTERLVNYFKKKNKKIINPKTREYLAQLYRDDILKLQDLIKRDLSKWLK